MIADPPRGAKVAFLQLSAGRFQIAVAFIIRPGLMNLPVPPLDGQDFILKKSVRHAGPQPERCRCF